MLGFQMCFGFVKIHIIFRPSVAVSLWSHVRVVVVADLPITPTLDPPYPCHVTVLCDGVGAGPLR